MDKTKGNDKYKTGGVDPVDLMVAGDMFRDFALGCIIKYAFRNRLTKHTIDGQSINIDDLNKIIHYAEMLKKI